MSNQFSTLAPAIEARLEGNAYFGVQEGGRKAIPVVTELIGNIENEVERLINEIGIAVVVMTPKVEPTGPLPTARSVTVLVGVSEDVVINQSGGAGTYAPAVDVIAAVDALLAGWSPGGSWTPMRVKGWNVVSTSPLLVYELIAVTTTILKPV